MRNQDQPSPETERQIRLLNTESMPSEFIDWQAVRRGRPQLADVEERKETH